MSYGYCKCGCGEKTAIAKNSHTASGWVKGEPKPYVNAGHAKRKHPHPYQVNEETGCWEWMWCISSCGYGALKRDGRVLKAHRVYYERHKGPIPDGLQIDHLCRNRRCVNPAHLEAVTKTENLRRGRVAKLNLEQVEAIRKLEGQERGADVARRYGVNRTTIYRIWKREKWVAA